jgi:hypothetical protein
MDLSSPIDSEPEKIRLWRKRAPKKRPGLPTVSPEEIVELLESRKPRENAEE